MDIHESPVYDDAFAADEFADDAAGFGTLDPRDLHRPAAPVAFGDPAAPSNSAEPPALSA